MGFPISKKEHGTAEPFVGNCMSVFRVHRLRRKLVAQGLPLDPISALWSVCTMGNYYSSLSLSFYYLNPNSCSRQILGSVGPTPCPAT